MTNPQATLRPADILLVDDHVTTTRLVTDLLGSAFPGLAFASLRTAAEALEMCGSCPPRLVIMDIGLPDRNGIDAARRIKALSPAVKVLMHSNHDHSVYQDASAVAGADAFVSKSRTHGELVSTVARLLNIPPRSGASDPERHDQ
jgi:DNA-binding NarL/FixJ family response regulator